LPVGTPIHLGAKIPPRRGQEGFRFFVFAQFVTEPQLDANWSAPRSETARIV
jgi:hypothetical protein